MAKLGHSQEACDLPKVNYPVRSASVALRLKLTLVIRRSNIGYVGVTASSLPLVAVGEANVFGSNNRSPSSFVGFVA